MFSCQRRGIIPKSGLVRGIIEVVITTNFTQCSLRVSDGWCPKSFSNVPFGLKEEKRLVTENRRGFGPLKN